MEFLRHWLETQERTEDDLSVHYQNFFKFRKNEDDNYDYDRSVRIPIQKISKEWIHSTS